MLQISYLKNNLFGLALCAALSTVSVAATAQTTAFKTIPDKLDEHRQNAFQEKLFLHVDRPAYLCGETMWFKLYLTDAVLHQPSNLSKVAYVEVLAADNKPVLQAKLQLKQGSGSGSFILPATLGSGNYKVRAYTSWMKNEGPAMFYEQPVTIVNTFQQLQPEAAPKTAGYTLQFFPEGGNLVTGVQNKLAFKGVNTATGKSIAYVGTLLTQQGDTVATFKPHKYGMGQLTFTPQQNTTYTAVVKTPEGKSFKAELPAVHSSGYTLQVQDTGSEQLKVVVNQVNETGAQVYLLGHARQQIIFSEAATLQNGMATFLVNKKDLADGITHFTLFNAAQKPVNERLYFKQPAKQLKLDVATNQQHYGRRQQVTAQIQANATAKYADLSVAVYKLDSLQQFTPQTIESYLWLTSDLNGTIEDPGYYFSEQGKTDAQAMDNLMLTHGWSRFKWEDILNRDIPSTAFLPELNGHLIKGKVTFKQNGEAAPGIVTYLSSPGKNIRLYNAASNADGHVLFEVKDYFGDRDIVLQSDYAKDSIYHFEIYSPFSDKFSGGALPSFSLSSKLADELTKRHIYLQTRQAYFGNSINRFKPLLADSIAFYGKASETYLLDKYKRFKVMEEVMREYVTGVQVRRRSGQFRFMVHNRTFKTVFQDNPMVLLDGVPVFKVDEIMAFDPLKVEKLEVVTNRFFHGAQAYNGIVSYTTYNGDLANFELNPNALLQTYQGMQLQREFYAPTYSTPEEKQSPLADFRNLLHWAPSLTAATGQQTDLSFYTSDAIGTYVIVLQGMTAEGEAGSKVYTIQVREPLARR